MEEMKSKYATKKTGKTEVYPFWNMEDITNMINWFKDKEDWDGYLTTMFGLLLGRRIGDTVSMKWSDLFNANGTRKLSIDTIEEQKTGKTTVIPISSTVYESIDLYVNKTNVDIKGNIDNYIFNIPCKTAWIQRKNNPVYNENDLDSWCNFLNKDFSEKRKQKILDDFKKNKKYLSLGEYLYYEVEYSDVVKWQTDGYRKKFDQAAKDCNIQYHVSCHSLRKTFGWISKMIHPDDPNALLTLQDIFSHSDTQTTMHYIGLSEERKRIYFEDMGEVVKNLENGNHDLKVNNSPVVTLKHEDLREILMYAIGNRPDSMSLFNDCMNMIDNKKIKSI